MNYILNIYQSQTLLDADTFEPVRLLDANLRVRYSAQQDGNVIDPQPEELIEQIVTQYRAAVEKFIKEKL